MEAMLFFQESVHISSTFALYLVSRQTNSAQAMENSNRVMISGNEAKAQKKRQGSVSISSSSRERE